MLPLPLGGAYDYRVPDGLCLAAGDFVTVPLASRQISGIVWGVGEGQVAAHKTKDVTARLDTPPLPEASRRFVEWVARYTVCPPGAVLKMAMSVPAARAAITTLRGTCGPCHDAHREETADGFRIKPGS